MPEGKVVPQSSNFASEVKRLESLIKSSMPDFDDIKEWSNKTLEEIKSQNQILCKTLPEISDMKKWLGQTIQDMDADKQ